ncbi:hypothetical protein KIPB_012397, partial [Kipferlia bialata]
RRKADPIRADRERQMQTQIRQLQTESEGLRAALQQESPRPPQRKRPPPLSTIETKKGARVHIPSSTQTHKMDGVKTTLPPSVPVSTRTPCIGTECHSKKGERSDVRECVSLRRDHRTRGERQLVDGEAESDTKKTKSKQVSTRKLESSEKDVEDSEETASESDMLMEGESEESAWEETGSESQSEDEGSESDTDISVRGPVTVPKQGSVGVVIGDARASCVRGHGRPLVTGNKHVESREVDTIEGRTASVLDAKWKAKLEELREYLSAHGVWPPQRSGTLGKWVGNQRFLHRKDNLSQRRVVALEGIGINWNPRGPQTEWTNRLTELKEYLSLHGSWPPVTSGPLGKWVDNQRTMRRRGQLSTEHEAALDELSFEWNPKGTVSLNAAWNHKLTELKMYLETHHSWPSQSAGSLGRWIDTQRVKFRKNKLPEDRVSALDVLGIDWNPADRR